MANIVMLESNSFLKFENLHNEFVSDPVGGEMVLYLNPLEH